MQFTFPISIPANTEPSDPTREITKVCYGLLNKVQIDFPWGCAGLVGIRILHYEHVLYPTNADQWFIGNKVSIIFDCNYAITQGWFNFSVEGYNEDDFYEHTPIVNLNVLPFQWSRPGTTPWVEG